MRVILDTILGLVCLAPIGLGLYLLLNESDKVLVQAQNVILKVSRKPLKDEDFKWLIKATKYSKGIGLVLAVLGFINFIALTLHQ